MTCFKLEFEGKKALEKSICADLTREYGLDYEFGTYVQFKDDGHAYEGRIIGFNPNTKKYKITYKNDANSIPDHEEKNHIIEIRKDGIVTPPPKTVNSEETLAPLIVSLLDKNDILSMSMLGPRGSKNVCAIDFDFKKIIETFLLSEKPHKSKPELLLKHYKLGGKRLTKKDTSASCPALRFTYSGIYLNGGTNEEAFYCNQVSYSKLIKKIFEKKPRELGYLLIYISVAIGKNLSILNRCNLTNGDVCSYLSSLKKTDDHQCAQRIEELAIEILGCLGSPRCHIDRSLSIEELQQQGWNITTNTNRKDRLKLFKIYNDNKDKFSQKLEGKLLSEAKPEEFDYFFRGSNARQNKGATDILRTISSITIKENIANREGGLSFDITFSPLFVACASYVNSKLNQIVFNSKTEYKKYSVLDMKCFLGRLAYSARKEEEYAFEVIFSSEDATKKAEEDMLKDAKKYGLIEKHSENTFRFSQKYIRIYLDGCFSAQSLEKQFIIESKVKDEHNKTNVVSAAIDQIFGFSKQEDLLDHLNFRLAEPSLFSLALLTQASMHFREKLIIELIARASNYEVKNGGRFEQELSAHILCYLLATNPDLFTYQNMKTAFSAACGRQLYPAQTALLREMMKSNAFFKEYPKKIFLEALEFDVDADGSYVFKRQPEFYFYQIFCQDKLDSTDHLSFLDLNSLAQYESWIKKDFKKAQICLKKAYDKEICNFNETTFSIQASGDAAVKKLYGMQLWLYALSNIYNLTSRCDADTFIVEKILDKKIEEKESVLKHLLKVIFYAEFFQKWQNPYYPSRINEMTMICGAFRFFSTFEIDSSVSLPSKNDSVLSIDYIKEYLNWMKGESKNSRYYWFQRRLLSYYTAQCPCDECESNYTSTAFLKYDNFSQSYNSFISNPRKLL